MTNENEVVSVGPDWMTVTTVKGDGVDDLQMIAFDIVQQHLPSDAVSKPWGMQGYRGKSYGSLKIGTRNSEEGILIISGELCRRAYSAIPIDPFAVTRLDLQVTLRLDKPDVDHAMRFYNEKRQLQNQNTSGKLWRLVSSATGNTLYYGKRGNVEMLRFYDKSIDYGFEQKGMAWRYEIEYGRKKAKAVADVVGAMEDPYAEIVGMVALAYKKAGFPPQFKHNTTISAIESAVEVKTASSQVRWLERNVRPVVTQLLMSGHEKEVIEALSLRQFCRERK